MPVIQGKSQATIGAKFTSIPHVLAPDDNSATGTETGSEATVTEKASCIPEPAK